MTGARQSHLVVIGLSYPFRGGISHYSTLLVRGLRKRHQVTFVTLSRQYPEFLFPGETQYDTSQRTISESNNPDIDSINPVTWWRVARRLNKSDPDLIVVQWWHPFFALAFGSIVRLLRKDLRSRVCFLCHNVLPHEANPLQALLSRFAFGPVGRFIVHSAEDERNLRHFRPSAEIKRGPHPSYDEFGKAAMESKAEARSALSIPLERNVVLFFGLIRRYKGLEHLIEAMGRITAQLDCQLVIAGEFYHQKAGYMELIAKHGLHDAVRVEDRYIPNEEVARFFLAADVVVLPYLSATQSGIVQIAFGLGTPVITTKVGGLPEAVDHGKTGLIVEPGDPEGLAAAILEYYSAGYETAFRAEIAKQGDRFAWEKEIGLLEAFLPHKEASPC